jgi:large subunit ribosomal protein L17
MAMKHRLKGRYLGRNSGERRALYRNLLVSFVEHEHMTTTEAKAKEIKSLAEHLVTVAREDNPHNRGLVMAALNSKLLTAKLFELIAPRFEGREGGYTRLYRVGRRLGDAAEMVRLEFVEL